MSFDMNLCVKGDKLISCHGDIFIYDGLNDCPCGIYNHRVIYPNGTTGTRDDDGQVFQKNKLPEDHDIVGFYK